MSDRLFDDMLDEMAWRLYLNWDMTANEAYHKAAEFIIEQALHRDETMEQRLKRLGVDAAKREA